MGGRGWEAKFTKYLRESYKEACSLSEAAGYGAGTANVFTQRMLFAAGLTDGRGRTWPPPPILISLICVVFSAFLAEPFHMLTLTARQVKVRRRAEKAKTNLISVRFL